jgi:tetratricopeptide (TPR) repeat protein
MGQCQSKSTPSSPPLPTTKTYSSNIQHQQQPNSLIFPNDNNNPTNNNLIFLSKPSPQLAGKSKLRGIQYSTLQQIAACGQIFVIPETRSSNTNNDVSSNNNTKITIPPTATLLWFIENIMKTSICSEGCSFSDLLLPYHHIAPETDSCTGLYVCHTVSLNFRDFIDSLAPYVPSEKPYVWIDIFQLDQHSTKNLRDWQLNHCHETIARFNHRLIVFDTFDNPSALQKSWTVWELFGIAQQQQQQQNNDNSQTTTTNLILPSTECIRFCDTVLVPDPDKVLLILDHLDVTRAHALSSTDQLQVFQAVDASVGTAVVNSLVLDRLRQWFIDAGMYVLDKSRNHTSNTMARDYDYEISLMRSIANLHRNNGSFEVAIKLLEEALECALEKFGKDTLIYAQVQGDLGCALSESGSYKEAKKALELCLEIYIRVLGEHSHWVADIEMAAAYNLRSGSEFKEALAMYEHALEIFRNHPGDAQNNNNHNNQHDSSLIRALDGVASCALELGDFNRACECGGEIVQMRRLEVQVNVSVHDDDNDDNSTDNNVDQILHLVEALNDHSIYLDLAGEETRSQEIREEVVKICQEAIEKISTDETTVNTMDHATLCVRLGEALAASNQQYEEALKMFEFANQVHSRVLGTDHALVLAVLTAQARCYEQLYQFDRSLEIHKKDLEYALLSPLGNANPGVSSAMSNIAYCYSKKNQYHQAQAWAEKVLQIRREYVPQSPLLASAITELGWILFERAEYEEALKLHYEAVDIRLELYNGETHPDIATDWDAIGENLEKLHQFQHAKDARNKAISIRERLLGYFHPETLGTRADLAHTFEVEGDLDTAFDLVQGILRDRTLHLGEFHSHTGRSHRNLGRLYKAKGEYVLAEEKLRTSVEIFENDYKKKQRKQSGVVLPDGPSIETRELLGEVLHLMKRYEEAKIEFERVIGAYLIFSGNNEENHNVAFAQHKLALVMKDEVMEKKQKNLSMLGEDRLLLLLEEDQLLQAEKLGKNAMEKLIKIRGIKHEDCKTVVKVWGGSSTLETTTTTTSTSGV